MAKQKTEQTTPPNTIDLAAIEKEDECLGRFLRLLLSLPRPLPGVLTIRMLGDLRKMEGLIRQGEINRRREGERKAAKKLHDAELKPARDALEEYAKVLKIADELDIMPGDIKRLAALAATAERTLEYALPLAGLDEESPAVAVFRKIRGRQQATAKV